MEFQITEAVELIKSLAETENLTLGEALRVFVAEAGLDLEYASELKGALFEIYTLREMAEDSLSNAMHGVFVSRQELQEVDTKETQEGTKYKVRVQDRASGSSYVRYATREKIAELRANPNISSVEITDHGSTGADDKGQRTAAAKAGRDYDGDGKRESSSKEHAGVVHNAIQRKMGGTPDGKDTRREEFEMEEGIDFKGARRIDDAREAKRKKEEDKHPILKDKRLGKGKFRPGGSDAEWKEGAREHLKAKDRVPSKKGKKMWEAYLEARQEINEARAKTKEEARKKLEAHQKAMKSGGESPYFGKPKKEGGKDPWSTHASDAKAHRKEDQHEGYKGKHGQSDKEYADSRSQGGKMISGDSKRSGAEYTHGRRVKAENPGMQPDVGGKTKPKSQGKMDKGTREDLKYRKANLRKEEFVYEADVYDSGRENQSQRDKAKSGKKIDGKGVDNSTRVKLMPTMEAVVTDSEMSKAEVLLRGSEVNEALRTKIQDFRDGLKEECCPKCGTPECTCEGKKDEKPKKKKAKLDEAGMPVFEAKAESRNNRRPGPSKDMIDPPADPQGPVGHMNPKGEPKRYKEAGEAPGDRRPNRKKDKSLPFEDGTVPNGSGV